MGILILTEQEKELAIEKVISEVNKKYGEGALVRGKDAKGLKINRIKSGSLAVDVCTGGGWGQGRVNEIYGPYCLDGNTMIHYHVPSWKSANHQKEAGSRVRLIRLEDLYKHFQKGEDVLVECVDELSNQVMLTRPLDIIKSGNKYVYKITTANFFEITSTSEHWFRTPSGYHQLNELMVGDTLYTVKRGNSTKTIDSRKDKEYVVKWHPWRKQTKKVGAYSYIRFREPTIIYEAYLNNMTVDEYVYFLNNYDGSEVITIAEGMHVHHINEDHSDNRIENLCLLDSSSHGLLHPDRALGNTRKVYEDKIISIEYIGNRMTYDICMPAPNHNFVADDFVVHNSGGKSYMWQVTLAQIQRDYPAATCAVIDFEQAFDDSWARKIGIDTDELLISSPDYMEDGLEIAVNLVKSGDVFAIFVDSLAAACPKAEYEGEMTDFTVGLRARLGNKFMRKNKPHVNLLTEEIDLGKTTMFIVNQTYTNIGGYGDPEVTPGGQQVRFGASVRMNIRKGETVEDKDGSFIMQESKFTITKNKTFPPHKRGAFWFSIQDNDKGKAGRIYRAGEIVTYGVFTGIIQRSGAWYNLPEEFGLAKSLQGEVAVANWIEENQDKFPRLEELVLNEIIKMGEDNE